MPGGKIPVHCSRRGLCQSISMIKRSKLGTSRSPIRLLKLFSIFLGRSTRRIPLVGMRVCCSAGHAALPFEPRRDALGAIRTLLGTARLRTRAGESRGRKFAVISRAGRSWSSFHGQWMNRPAGSRALFPPDARPIYPEDEDLTARGERRPLAARFEFHLGPLLLLCPIHSRGRVGVPSARSRRVASAVSGSELSSGAVSRRHLRHGLPRPARPGSRNADSSELEVVI